MNRETIDQEIAIIGMAGRFPGARSVDEFWENLRNGVESISFFSDQEVVASGVDSAILHNPNYVKAHGVLEGIELFDASFFGYSPREAEAIDPQHRIFLECAWEALESAGYNTETDQCRVSVYAGTSRSNYLDGLRSNRDIMDALNSHQLIFGNEKDYLPTRVSYILNLKGPSVAVQTACSTSLVAVHFASQSLLNGESDMALAGGVTIRVPQRVGYIYQEGSVYSPDGHCRAFDADARGIVDGSGAGIVVLKRLADALADGDHIHAIIKGSAINNDGSVKIGYTAPSVEGQAEVIAEALALAGVESETVTYIETHGTGTALGDPIEIDALTQAFRAQTEKKGFCAIGSVKTNIGHLDSAAGVVGLIKTILALKHRQIPPSLHFKHPNPQIDFANSPFYVNTVLTEWKADKTPRRAGVSSFGIGGTNAHVLLEEAPPAMPSGRTRPLQLLTLSAKTGPALEAATMNLVNYLKPHPASELADVAYTYQTGRRTFDYRRVVVCQNAGDAASMLEAYHPQHVFTSFQKSTDRPVAFMFPGGGTQYANMGAELYRVEATFREQIDLCAGLLNPYLGVDLRSVLYPEERQVEAVTEQLKQTSLALPALFATEYALAQLWISWGVHPKVMIGHSLGEYVAACLAGVFSLKDALALVALRGKLLGQLPKGATLSVSLSPGEVQILLGQKLSLAAINGPSLCVVSGPVDAIEDLQQLLVEKGVAVRRVQIDVAAHSEMITPILWEFRQFIETLDLQAPAIPYISNLTGSWITASEATDPGYWVRHLRQTVRFAEGLHSLLQESGRILLEVGPGQTLSTLVQQQIDSATEQVVLTSLRHPYAQYSDVAFLLNTVGRFWLSGGKVDWQRFYELERRQRLPLPTYPFERKRYWVEPQPFPRYVRASQITSPEGLPAADGFSIPSWKRSGPPHLAAIEDGANQRACWLIFADTCGIGARLVKRLEGEGVDVVSVEEGEQFSKPDDHTYCINARRREDYEALLRDIQSPIRIAHLWSLTANHEIGSGPEDSEEIQERGFYSLLALVQALGAQKKTGDQRIVVVSNQGQEVIGNETLCPEKATMLGLCKVIPQEYEHISCCSVDIALPTAGTRDEEQLIDQLLAELSAGQPEPHSLVAYRGKHRWVACFEPVQLAGSAEGKTLLREGGVYLVTGGLGRVGLEMAEYLVRSVRAKLILIGRSALPSREEWDRWLVTHEDEMSRKIRKVQMLEMLGAEVLTLSADVSNPEQMQAAVLQAYERFGIIHGIIHAAGSADSGVIQSKTPEATARALTPKIKGTQVLDAIFQEKALDFFLLCSSHSSILGRYGESDCCAGDSFLDAFAHARSSTDGTYFLSVNWDRWQDTAQTTEEQKGEVLDAFRRILCQRTLPQVVVSTRQIQTMHKQSESTAARQEPENEHRSQKAKAYAAPTNELEQTIADLWQKLLGSEEIGIDDNFFELGGNSLMAAQLIARLRETFLVEISLRSIFEEPTVARLAKVVEKAFLAKMETLSEEEIQHLMSNGPRYVI